LQNDSKKESTRKRISAKINDQQAALTKERREKTQAGWTHKAQYGAALGWLRKLKNR
jgi:hypothetical protein